MNFPTREIRAPRSTITPKQGGKMHDKHKHKNKSPFVRDVVVPDALSALKMFTLSCKASIAHFKSDMLSLCFQV